MATIFSKRRRPILEFIGQSLLLISIIASIIYGTSTYPAGQGYHLLAKTIPVGLLALYAFINIRTPDHILLGLALTMSALGDLSLELPVSDSFLRGLNGFTAAHLMFIILFLRNKTAVENISSRRLHVASFLWLFATVSCILLYPELVEMKWKVLAYTVAVTGMATAAIISRYPVWMVGLGGSLFLLSDAILGANQFLSVPTWVAGFIWVFYYTAQFLITLGVMLAPDRERRYRGYSF